jgi:acetyl esterase/lipase
MWRTLPIGTFVLVAGSLLPIARGPADAQAEDEMLFKRTFTYKTAGPTRIELDVHRAARKARLPVLVWIHGGALIVGSRTSIPSQLLDLCRSEGYALVSIDYRLAPEVKAPAIIEDVQDAFRWVRQEGPAASGLDPERIVVAGGSAGGYLTMMTGWCVDPRPKALVAYWGYGDVDGAWYTKPSEHYRTTIPLIDREIAYQAVGGPVLTETEGGTPEQDGRGLFYRYLRQNGLWTQVVTGLDPATQSAELDELCPVRNITAEYPPILMIHGTNDTDVPYEQSAAMAAELTRQGVPHELVTVDGAEHGLADGDPAEVAAAHARAAEFIRQHLP